MSDPRNQGLYSKEVLANLLNISERRIEQLAKQKIIPKAGRGVFDLGSTVQAYVRYLQGICNGSIQNKDTSELDKRLLEARVLERESKARQAKYRADRMEQELKINNDKRKLDRLHIRIVDELANIRPFDESTRDYMTRTIKRIIYEALHGDDAE